MRFRVWGLLASLGLLGLGGCADFVRGDYWELEAQDDGDGAVGELSYAADVHGLLNSGCERCHGDGKSAGNTGFVILPQAIDASYTSTLEFVDVDSPDDSRLLSKMAGASHGGGTIFDDRSPEYDIILTWIEQGALP